MGLQLCEGITSAVPATQARCCVQQPQGSSTATLLHPVTPAAPCPLCRRHEALGSPARVRPANARTTPGLSFLSCEMCPHVGLGAARPRAAASLHPCPQARQTSSTVYSRVPVLPATWHSAPSSTSPHFPDGETEAGDMQPRRHTAPQGQSPEALPGRPSPSGLLGSHPLPLLLHPPAGCLSASRPQLGERLPEETQRLLPAAIPGRSVHSSWGPASRAGARAGARHLEEPLPGLLRPGGRWGPGQGGRWDRRRWP